MKRYLQKIVYCTDGKLCDADLSGEGILCITDNEKCLLRLKEHGLPVAAWLHEGNKDRDLSAAFYAVESPEELDQDFFEKIYRREKNIPWDILETDRCLVREMMPEDAAAFAEIYREPAITRYAKDFHEDEAGEAEYIRTYQQQYRFFEYGVWSVVLKSTGEVIGRVGFSPAPADCEEITQNESQSNIGDRGFEFPQFGYMIGVPWQGQGLAYEVCRAILKYAREELGFETISLWVEESNEASRNLCRKLGFLQEKIVTPPGWCYYEYACDSQKRGNRRGKNEAN